MPTTKTKKPPKTSTPKTSNKSNTNKTFQGKLLSEHLQNYFGFNSFKEPQEEIINSLLSGKDTL